MKNFKLLLVFSALFCLFPCFSSAQIAGSKPFDRYYQRKGIAKAMQNGVTGTKNIFFLTSTIPFSFSRLEKVDSVWKLGPTINLGYGGVFILGKGTKNDDGTRTINPFLSFGISGDFGFKQENDNLKTTLNGNLMIGFDKIAFTFGKDFLNNTTFIGVSARLDVFTISHDHMVLFKEWDLKP